LSQLKPYLALYSLLAHFRSFQNQKSELAWRMEIPPPPIFMLQCNSNPLVTADLVVSETSGVQVSVAPTWQPPLTGTVKMHPSMREMVVLG
jgi:hypothetical protein